MAELMQSADAPLMKFFNERRSTRSTGASFGR
jgi:hypothetical protein